MLRDNNLDGNEYSFMFAALAEKHNAVIRKIRELPPWEWGCEFLELEPQVLRFLGTFAKRYPECAAFKTAYTLASALAAYRLDSRKPKTLSEQERATCIAANRNLVDDYSDALLLAYKDIFRFLFKKCGDTALDATTAILEAIKEEHERTRRQIIKRIIPKFKTRERGGEITQEQVARDFGVSRATVNRCNAAGVPTDSFGTTIGTWPAYSTGKLAKSRANRPLPSKNG